MSTRNVCLAQIGCGYWGPNLLRSFAAQAGCQVKWVVDQSPVRRAFVESNYPSTRTAADWPTSLRDPEVEAVVIATPAPTHFEVASAALEAGKHVYVEKPMTLNTPHAEALVNLAERCGRKLMVGHLLEYHPAVEYIKKQLDAGALGKIYYMYCQRLNLGVVRRDENAFWSLAPHDISVVLYLFGLEPDRITANGQCYVQPNVEDVVFANLHFPDGRMAQIHVSWLDPHKERRMVVVGSQKMLVFDDMEAAEKVRVYDKGATLQPGTANVVEAITVRHGDILIPRIPPSEPLDAETRHFLDCIRNNTRPRSDGLDGLRVVRILEQVDQLLHGGASR
jgi:predicted dehydrogenase